MRNLTVLNERPTLPAGVGWLATISSLLAPFRRAGCLRLREGEGPWGQDCAEALGEHDRTVWALQAYYDKCHDVVVALQTTVRIRRPAEDFPHVRTPFSPCQRWPWRARATRTQQGHEGSPLVPSACLPRCRPCETRAVRNFLWKSTLDALPRLDRLPRAPGLHEVPRRGNRPG